MYRRYSEFQEFYSKLVSLFPMANLPKLPGRSVSTKYYLPNPLKLLVCYEWVSGVFWATHKMGTAPQFKDFVKQIVDMGVINPAESKCGLIFELGLLTNWNLTVMYRNWCWNIIEWLCYKRFKLVLIADRWGIVTVHAFEYSELPEYSMANCKVCYLILSTSNE